MSSPSRFLALALAAVFTGLFAPASVSNTGEPKDKRGGLIEAVGFDAAGDYGERRISSPWHGRHAVVGGLGFQLLLSPWPRLLQRGELDVFNRQHNREIYDYVAFQDLGELRAVGRAGSMKAEVPPRVQAGSWCYRTYVFGRGDAALELTVSRLTPAILIRLRASAIELFAGQKRGNRKRNDVTVAVPGYVAFIGRGGRVVVRSTAGPIALDKIGESWLLFWFGPEGYLRRTRIPNILARLDIPRVIQRGRYLEPSDLPVLCVFQRRPQRVEPTEDSLRVVFNSPEAGAIILLPLFGSVHLPADRTARWQSAFPSEVLDRCRVWSKRLKHFPISASEAYRMEPNGDVTVRQRFQFVELPDDWKTAGERLAPLPPVVALCHQQGFPVEISALSGQRPRSSRRLADHEIATHSGPYGGIPGAEELAFTVRGLSRYVDRPPTWPAARSRQARRLAEELQREVKKLLEADQLMPATNVIGWLERHFENPGETVLAVAEALPYLTERQREEAKSWLARFVDRYDPLSSEGLPVAGARREYGEPDPVEPIRTVERPVRWEDRANTLYALWLLAHVTGDWEQIDRRAESIRRVAELAIGRLDWATCSYFRGPREDRSSARGHRGEDRGSTWAANGQFARWVALTRIAQHWRDARLEARARYLLARTMLVRFAQAALFQYGYEQDLMRVELEPDWMLRLSTRTGNGGGPGLLWLPHWKEAKDDVRAVIQWDELGPVVAQTLNHFWQPVLPHFQDLTPECGWFLADHLRDRCVRVLEAVELNAPAWHLTLRPAYLGKEMHADSPRNSFSIFLAHCYVARTPGEKMLRYQDIPFVRVGDLYHIRRLVANLRAFARADHREGSP